MSNECRKVHWHGIWWGSTGEYLTIGRAYSMAGLNYIVHPHIDNPNCTPDSYFNELQTYIDFKPSLVNARGRFIEGNIPKLISSTKYYNRRVLFVASLFNYSNYEEFMALVEAESFFAETIGRNTQYFPFSLWQDGQRLEGSYVPMFTFDDHMLLAKSTDTKSECEDRGIDISKTLLIYKAAGRRRGEWDRETYDSSSWLLHEMNIPKPMRRDPALLWNPSLNIQEDLLMNQE